MALYVKVKNNEPVEYPINYDQIYDLILEPNGKDKLPIDTEFLNANGYYSVVEQDAPSIAPTTRLSMGLPRLVNGIWYENYVMTEMTNEEKAENNEAKSYEMRQSRDGMLRETVDRMSPIRWESLTTEQKAGWTKYRQDLLDLPTQEGFPFDVTWPTEPE